jgi:hypothetical protein
MKFWTKPSGSGDKQLIVPSDSAGEIRFKGHAAGDFRKEKEK